MCQLEDFKHLLLDEEHRNILNGELEWWHEAYLPVPSGKGSVQLDIGAGNGETAQLYLNHGVEHVICIEPNSDLLYKNFGNDPRVTINPFAISGIKSDCEGGEKNMILEAHNFFKLIPVKPSKMLDRTTTCWRIQDIKNLNKLMGVIPRQTPLVNLHLLRIQAAHFIKRTLRGMF